MSTAGEGVRFAVTASHSYVTALVQGEPDPFNEAPPAPAGPYQNGRDETRAGMWDSSAQQHWAEAEQAWTAGIAQPSGLPSVAPQNVLMQPMFEEESTTSRKVEREDLDEVPAHAVASTYPQLPIGSLNGGRPLPWESGFPGGGSSGVETVVNSNTGNLNLRVPIMSWKMRGGMEIDFSLYYNSRSQVWTRFGRNWSSSFDAFIWKFPVIPGLSSLFVRWGDGSIVKFDQTAPGSWTYKSPAGIHETITESFPNPDTYTLKTKSGMKYVFQQLNASPVWFLTKIQERISSNEIIIHREASNPYTLTRVSEPGLGDRLSVGAITGSRVTTINDFTIGGNRTWTLGYANNGENIASITYPQSGGGGPTRSFTYEYIEGLPFLESETDLRGKTWYWSFDSAGVCLSYSTPTTYIMVDELPAYYFQYTGDSCTWVKPYRGNYGSGFRTSQRHQYSAGRISHVYDEAGFYESMTWTVGDLSVYKDKRQAMWAYVYDANGNVTQTTTPTGEIQKYTYTADNDLESTYSDQVAPSVHRFSYSDGRCINVTRRANPIGIDNAQASATIAGPGQHHGQYLSVTPWGPGGGTAWNIVYRTDDRYRQFIEKLIDPQGNQTLVNVDEWGRVLTVTPPGQSATTITYDGRMRPYRVTHPGGDYVEVTYDGEDNVTSLRDELGRVSYWTYDDDGRLISYQNPKGEVETYIYDAQSFLHQVTNARGYTRTYVPNLRNEVYRLTHADNQKEYWSYYATGEVAAHVDGFGTADQTVVSYGVDASGRPTGITYPEGSGTPNVVITYSNYGQTVTMVDGSGTSKWIHDGFDRLTRFEQPGWNIDYGYSLYHDTPVSMTDPSGVTGYQYDSRGNLWKLTNPVNEVTEWLYDPAGRLSQRKLGNGTWEEVTYDSRSRVTGIALKKPGATLRQHTYGYNAVSNVTSHSVAGVTTSYGYDLADQLTSESRPGYAASYTYDANGNRATRTVNGVTETYVNDVADKLTSISVGGNTVRSFTYDGRGRRKTDWVPGSTATYSWDAESRLVSVARPGVTTNAFGYNGLDARVSKTDSTGTYGFKRNGAGVTDPVLSDGAATYTPGISERRGGNSKFLHSGMKNADAQSGASANVDSSRTYDAFGNLTGSSGTWSGPFGYAGGFGYQEDPDHGLRLLGHRYYDSSSGRFISKDPAGQGRNWNNYCSQNPLGAVDPNGLDHFVIVVGQGNYDEDILPSRFLELARKLENFLKGLGHTVKILLRPTIGTLEDQLATADGLVYVGHGSPGGWWITQKRGGMGKMLSLSPHKLKLILKGRKLKTIVAVTCNTFASDAMGKQWEECADKVFGFTGSAPHVSSFSEVFEDWVKKRSPKGPSRLPRRGGRGSPIMPGDFGWGKGG